MSYDKKIHGGYYEGIYNYIAAGGRHVMFSIGDWQGDHLVFFERNGQYGILNHAYGSCSHCDPYESCGSDEERASLAEDYKASVRWFDNKAEFLDYCENKWLAGDAGYHIDESDYVNIYTKEARKFANV